MTRTQPKLGRLGGLVLLATSLLGSSVFVVPVLGVQMAGSGALVSWLLLISFMLPMALVFGRLGRTYPHAGGVSHWVGRALGPRAEWTIALVLISVIPVGLPAALLLAMVFLKQLIPLPKPYDLLAQLSVLACCYGLNRAGLKASAWVQTLIILGTLAFICALAIATPVSLAASTPRFDGADLGSVFQAAGLMLWCFLGLEIVANLAEEFKDPERDIPWVVFGGVMLAGIVYYLCSATVIAAGFEQVTAEALILVAQAHFGPAGAIALSVFGFAACFASVNTYVNGFSRGLWSLADEGKLARFLARRDSREVPTGALNTIMLVCALCTLIFYLDWFDLPQLILLANAHFVLVYLAAMISAVCLLRGSARVVAILGTMACLVGYASLGWAAVYGGIVLAVLAILAPRGAVSAPAATG